MDITTLFRSRIEVVRNRNKALGQDTVDKAGNIISPSHGGVKSKIFPGKKSEYFIKSRELCTLITNLRDFLQENRPSYLNIMSRSSNSEYSSPFGPEMMREGTAPKMSDYERDQIDSNTQKIIQNCQKRIFEFEKFVESSETVRNNPQLNSHLDSIIHSLTVYLKDVCQVYSEMRAIRVKRTLDLQSLSRLELSSKAASKSKLDYKSSQETLNQPFTSNKLKSKNFPSSSNDDFYDAEEDSTKKGYDYDENLSPEEAQMLEEENADLLKRLNTVSDEVDQVQSSVIQIAQLQEIFTEKVLHQEKEVEKIGSLVVGATENIKGGNEQIRQAIQKNADFRAWVLFFILVMSFSLLFLDWYND